MIQRRERLRFAREARQPLRIVCECLGQDLDRDVAIQLGIARAKHLAHPAFTDPGSDFVDAETSARGKRQAADYKVEAQGNSTAETGQQSQPLWRESASNHDAPDTCRVLIAW
jgi:hypothetical protein